MNKEPTEKELKRFWEWCGLKYEDPYWVNEDCREGQCCFYGEYYAELLGTLTLNNLFKWAVPKLRDCDLTWDITEHEWVVRVAMFFNIGKTGEVRENTEWNKDPALALFWAINKIIDNSPPW